MTDIVAFILVAPLLLATAVFSVEVWMGTLPRRPSNQNTGNPASVVVLIPAHDEERGIGAVITAIRAGMPVGFRILVVADNCSDSTAAIATAAGVDVVERSDAVRRGKGFALDCGRAWLASDPPACVVVVDADTVPALGAVERVASAAIRADRPVQGVYTLAVDDCDSSIARFSAAAFYVKNAVRQLGAARIGAPADLAGSGMAFPWRVFETIPLATGHVAEDLMIGVHCALVGDTPLFDSSAAVTGVTASDRGTAVQRRRWESGFLQVSTDSAFPLIGRSIATLRPALGWLGLHLLTPPFLPLLAADVLAAAVLGTMWLAGFGGDAFFVTAVLTFVASTGVVVALISHGRGDLLRGWQMMPAYIIWKLSLSARTLFSREQSWIRTDRD